MSLDTNVEELMRFLPNGVTGVIWFGEHKMMFAFEVSDNLDTTALANDIAQQLERAKRRTVGIAKQKKKEAQK